MTVNSRVIKVFLGWSPDAVDVPLMNGLRVQILPTTEDLPRARKHQFAAFVASEALLVVWDDDALHLIERAKAIESELMELVWKTGEPADMEQGTSKFGPIVAAVEIDEESGEVLPQSRPTKLLNSVLVSFTIIIIIVVLGSGCNSIVVEVAVDHNYLRFLFLLLTPIQIFFTLVGSQFGGGGGGEECQAANSLFAVFRPGNCGLPCAMFWPCKTNDAELKVLLCTLFSPPPKPSPSPYYHPMPCLQGRPTLRHRPDGPIYQAGHFNVRTSGWVGKHVHQ